MNIQTKKSDNGNVMTIFLPERFDFEVHGEFRDAYASEKKACTLVLDMNKTNYMDSSALGMMLQIKEHAETCNGKVNIRNAKENILQIIKIAHFDKIFNIE